MKCPKCGRKQYYTCGRKECPDQDIPKGKKFQIYRQLLWGRIPIPWPHSNWLWNLMSKFGIAAVNQIAEILECPYCHYADLFDNWEDRAIRTALKHGWIT